MKKKPYKIFSGKFRVANLYEIFQDRISSNGSIGRDGVRVSQFSSNLDTEIALIAKKVMDGKYKFTRYREKLISKGAYKAPRIISIPTIRDSLTLRALCDFLTEIYPDCVTKKPHEYIRAIKDDISESNYSRGWSAGENRLTGERA